MATLLSPLPDLDHHRDALRRARYAVRSAKAEVYRAEGRRRATSQLFDWAKRTSVAVAVREHLLAERHAAYAAESTARAAWRAAKEQAAAALEAWRVAKRQTED